MYLKNIVILVLVGIGVFPAASFGQHSVARTWNEQLLGAIRSDYARPTVHARNLFHTAIVLYDGWAIYSDQAEPYLLGKTVSGFSCPMDSFTPQANGIEETISYAAYRLLSHRFANSPGAQKSLAGFKERMYDLGFDPHITSTDYKSGSAAALGNYLGRCMIEFGLQDGANEQGNYVNAYYEHVNPPLVPDLPGNSGMTDPNRWQPLALEAFVDQSGNLLPGNIPEFLGAEWGKLVPFALDHFDMSIQKRDDDYYWIYDDPGTPPLLEITQSGGLSEEYKWGFGLVSIWSSHLDPADGVMWDVSPGAIGNIQELPDTPQEYRAFYNLLEGGDPGIGHEINPHTGQPYEPQLVRRGDYTRVLAEFWADGPDSETPPGHWFTILNYVSNHPFLEKRLRGTGPELSDLEWDVKAYFALGGAVHDAAVAAWSIKGWYDYVRPISAIRYMAELGQSSDPDLPSYHPRGMQLVEGYVELVKEGDQLAGTNNQHVGKIKVYAWRGPGYSQNSNTDKAGVEWILAEDWWPYQRPTFVTPPFAGYISGHSAFSRAAAEVLTLLTGDPYFPGGLGEFHAKKDEFLVFEEGPSQDITLQWATYRDASDQTSLSRIWGGIHPPADDIPGRKIGMKIGIQAFEKAERYFKGEVPTEGEQPLAVTMYPNPIRSGQALTVELMNPSENVLIELYNILGQKVQTRKIEVLTIRTVFDTSSLASGLYLLRVRSEDGKSVHKVLVLK